MRTQDTPPTAGSALKPAAMILAALALAAGGYLAGRHSAVASGGRDAPDAPGAPADAEGRGAGGERGGVLAAAGSSGDSSVAAGWNAGDWSALRARPGSRARNQSLADFLKKLAQTAPDRARALAEAEKNLALKADLMKAVLRGWSQADPEAAARWVLGQPAGSDRGASMAVIFSELASRPEVAERVAQAACQADAGAATSYGSSLIEALCGNGSFDAAARFAQSGDGGVQQSIWLSDAFTQWSSYQPQEAAQAAEGLPDPSQRLAALHGVVGGWSETDPAGLTQFLAQLPGGPDRTQMLGQAIRSWSAVDPNAVSAWVSSSSLGADADGTTILVSAMASVKPDQAAGWAQSIADPQQRSTALLGVLQDWVRADPAAAKQYFDTTTNILPADRDQAAKLFLGP